MTDRLPRITVDSCCPVRIREASDAGDMLATFKALSDATRLGIFTLIAAQGEPICACDIVDRFAVSQPTIAHHLRTLREAGLITAERRGVWVYYAVDSRGVDRLEGFVERMAASVRSGQTMGR